MDMLWLHPRHWNGRSCEAFSGRGPRCEGLRQMLKQAITANDAWHPKGDSLLVQLTENSLLTMNSEAESRRIPLQFADIMWSQMEGMVSRGKLFEAETTEQLQDVEKCVFCVAPRWGMMEIGTAKGLDAEIEDVWFLCAQLTDGQLEHVLQQMGRAGSLRWDFNETYLLTKRVLGSGGFSIVYDGLRRSGFTSLASILQDEEDEECSILSTHERPSYVALKLLQKIDSTEHATSVINEVFFLSLCGSHPNIPTLLGTFLCQQRYKTAWVIIMERCSSGRLSEYVDANGPFLLSRGDIMAIGILSAVAFLHSKNIIHRDIRPEKVLLSDRMDPILVDLGQAAHLTDSVAMMRRLGAAGYVAPEVLDTRSPGYGSLSDVFSAGCVLFFFYCGVEAYRDANYSATLQRTLAGKARFNHPKVKQVRSGTLHLLKKMLAASPKKRPRAHKGCKALWNLGDDEVKESPSAQQAFACLPDLEGETESYARLQPVQEIFREEFDDDEVESPSCSANLSNLAPFKPNSTSTYKSLPPGSVPSELQIPRPPSTHSARSTGFFGRFKRRTAP